MKIAIVGAAGNVGQRLVSEAQDRGHTITAIGPTASKLSTLGTSQTVTAVMSDTPALTEAFKGHDVVLSAVRFVNYQAPQLLEPVRAAGSPRLVVVGGAGSLMSPAGGLVAEGANFPDAAKPEAAAGSLMLEALRQEDQIDWVFVSPSALFTAGDRTGAFRLGQDMLLVDADGKSQARDRKDGLDGHVLVSSDLNM